MWYYARSILDFWGKRICYCISISIRSKYSLNIIIHHYPYRYNICWRNDSDSVVSISGTGSNQRGIELAGLLGSFIPKYWPVTLQKSEIGKNRKYIFIKEGKILVIHLSLWHCSRNLRSEKQIMKKTKYVLQLIYPQIHQIHWRNQGKEKKEQNIMNERNYSLQFVWTRRTWPRLMSKHLESWINFLLMKHKGK